MKGKQAPLEDREPREAARAKGLKQYAGHECRACHATKRFVSNNACVACKAVADRLRYFQITNPTRRYLEEDSSPNISRNANLAFLSALSTEANKS